MAPQIEMVDSESLDIVGASEAANILGVERPRISKWIKKGQMPEPKKLECGPIWNRREIVAFGKERKQQARQRERDRAARNRERDREAQKRRKTAIAA